MLDVVPGANLALPGDVVTVALPGPFDLCAAVLGADGRVGGDADFVFWSHTSTPGVTLAAGRLTVTPSRLRAGTERVVVLAAPEQAGRTFGELPAPAVTVSDGTGRVFARLVAASLRTETALQLAEVYRRTGGWRLRAIGQGYADGLAGLARDFGVDVAGDTGPVEEVVTATNAERTRHGLAPLTIDSRLVRAAQAHTEDMVRRAFFAHESPDGTQVWDRAVAAGYTYRKVAENIAAGQRSAGEVVLGWMNSPGHRANILDGELTQIGVGHATGGEYGVTWTQVFGSPR